MKDILYSKDKIGELLRSTRKSKELRQEDIAQQTGLSISTISNIERGNHDVREENIFAYVEFFNLTADLLGKVSERAELEKKIYRQLLRIEKIIHANPNEALDQINQINIDTPLSDVSTLAPISSYIWGRCYFEKKKWPVSKQYLIDAIQLIDDQRNEQPDLLASNIQSICFNDLSIISFFSGNYYDSLKYVKKGLMSFQTKGERLYSKYILLLNKAIYLEKLDRVEDTIKTLEELQKIITDTQDQPSAYQVVRISVIIQYYDLYANVLNKQNMATKALEYAYKGFELAWLNKEYDRLFTLWTTLGKIFFKKGDFAESEEQFLSALNIKLKVNSQYLLSPAYIGLARLYLKQHKPALARYYVDEALLIISKSNNDPQETIEALQVLGDCYRDQDLHKEAIDMYEQSLQLAEKNDILYYQLESLETLTVSYDKLGDRDKFFEYLERTYRIRKKIQQEGGDYFWINDSAATLNTKLHQ